MENLETIVGDTAAAAGDTIIGAALKRAAKASAKKSATKASVKALGKNVLDTLYGKPTFRMPDRSGAFNRRPTDPINTSNRRMAHVDLPYMADGQPAGFVLEASIYRKDERFQKGKQWHEKRTLSFSFPRGAIRPAPGDVAAKIHADNFAVSMIDAYEKWIATVDVSKLVQRSKSTAGRTTVVEIDAPESDD